MSITIFMRKLWAFIADSHDAKVIYNIDKVDGSVRLFQSTNTGESWNELINSTQPFGHKLITHPTNATRLLFDDGGKGFLLSDDRGENWRKILQPFNQDNQPAVSHPFSSIISIVCNPANVDGLVAITENGVFESSDLGEHWVAINMRFNELLFSSDIVKLSTTSSAVYASGSSGGTFKLVNKLDYNEATTCLLNWAEGEYPSIFGTTSPTTQFWGGYLYRYYSDTNTYVGFFHGQEVHMLRPHLSSEISTHGEVGFYLGLSGCDQ